MAVEKGNTAGKTDATFAPNGQCTKAQIITFLYRYLGKQQAAGQQTAAQPASGGLVNTVPGVEFTPEPLTEDQARRAAEKSGALLRGEGQLLWDENGNPYYEY